MFEVGFGQIVITLGLGAVLLGRKELPSASRVAGRGVGKLVALLRFTRASLDRITSSVEGGGAGLSGEEFRRLRDDVRKSLDELEGVKRELENATSNASPNRTMRSFMLNKPQQNDSSFSHPTSSTRSLASPVSPPSLRFDPLANIDASLRTSTSSTGISGSSLGNLTSSSSLANPSHRPAPPSFAPSLLQTTGALAESAWAAAPGSSPSGFKSGGTENGSKGESGAEIVTQLMRETLLHDHFELQGRKKV